MRCKLSLALPAMPVKTAPIQRDATASAPVSNARVRRAARILDVVGRLGIDVRRLWLLVCALLLAGAAQVARAEQSDPLNPAPTIDRDRVDRQVPVLPTAAPRAAPAPRAPVVDEGAATRAVTLAGFRYEGSSLPRAELDAALAPLLGRSLTRETLQAIADTINRVYASSDVAFYSIAIPQQVVTRGELVVRIVEGRISRYALQKETRTTPTRLIGAHMDRLMRDRPTHKSELERTLSLLRDIPGQTVDAQLRTTGRPDELALDLGVKRKQVDVAININNNGVVNVVSGVQAQVSVAVNGLLREGDSTRISGYLPFTPDRYQFYSLSHVTPIGANGMMLSASAAHIRTKTEDGLRGRVTQGGLGLSYPVVRSYRRNLSLSLSLDGIDSDNYFLDTAFGAFRTRVARASASWSAIGKRGGYAVSATASQGLDALGARAFAGFSEAGFTKANLQAAAVRELGSGMAVKITVRGQHSADQLPTSERISLGGDGAGMAFRLGAVTAESAIAGSVELSWKVKGAKRGAGGVTVFAYSDGALAHTVARPRYNLSARDFSLASAGVGARVAPFGGWTATVQVAVPVKRPFGDYGRKARVFFSLGRAI